MFVPVPYVVYVEYCWGQASQLQSFTKGFSPGLLCPDPKMGLLCSSVQAGRDLMVHMLPARGSAGARLLKAVLVMATCAASYQPACALTHLLASTDVC